MAKYPTMHSTTPNNNYPALMVRKSTFTNEMEVFGFPKSRAVLGQALEFHRKNNSVHSFSPNIKFTLHHSDLFHHTLGPTSIQSAALFSM